MMGTVLVTGGAGFVGSHTCKALAKAGYKPVVYDNLSNGRAEAAMWGPLVVGDIENHARFARTLERWKPIAVVHLAGSIEAGESVRNPLRFYHNNVVATIALVREMLAAGVYHIVFSSSGAVYGTPRENPISEEAPPNPTSPYGRSKLMGEQILLDAVRAHGMKAALLRYFNATGADPDGELGENHRVETHLIPLAVQAATGLRGPLIVFGADYPTADGTCVRDYVHVTDLAEAHVLALKRVMNFGGSITANLGTGVGHSVLEVLAAVHNVVGSPVPYRIAGRRPGDPACLVANANRARTDLKWKPRYPLLDEQVRDCAAWIMGGGWRPAYQVANGAALWGCQSLKDGGSSDIRLASNEPEPASE